MSTEGHAIELGEGTGSLFPPSTRYRVLTTIASSDIATVYVGSLSGPGGFERRVAIKRTHPRLLNESTSRRMVDEARLASRIQHPNVVGVRDVEELDGELLLIMDYVEGVSLSRLLDGGPIPPRVAGRILLDAATGLAAVHALADSGEMSGDVVHRNVSPSNILVGTDGTSRLSDFGIARGTLTTASGKSPVGLGRGGPAYLAPEYIENGTATPLLDVFALGVVAWETLTSRRLFRAPTDTETTERIRGGVVPPLSDLVSGLTPEIDVVILGALARDPYERSSARELAVGLEKALQRAGLLSSRREVEELVLQRCAETIQERRRRIRAATHTGEGSLSVPPTLPPSGRFPIDPRTSLERRSAAPPPVVPLKRSARELVATVPPSRIKTWRTLSASVIGAVAIALFAWGGSPQTTATPQSVPSPTSATANTMALVQAPAPSRPAGAEQAVVSAPAVEQAKRSTPTPAPGHVSALPVPVVNVLDCESLYDRGQHLRTAGDPAGAAALYRAALQQNPRYLPPQIALADLEWEQGRTEQARAAYAHLTEHYAPDLLPPRVTMRAKSEDSH